MKVNPLWPATAKSSLVLDGDTVKLRLLAEREHSSSLVHVDWVRFTTMVKNAPIPGVDILFPKKWDSIWFEDTTKLVEKSIREFSESDFPATSQAHALAVKVAQCLGSAFEVDQEPKRGIDFYKFRWSILLNGTECAWVGFLSSSDSPRQQKQNDTIHANVMGSACTFADSGWRDRMADLIDECAADVTRADLALDFFDGYTGGIESVRQAYRVGLCNVGGRKLKFNLVGDWENDHDRSIYIGSREVGKITNIYEKGDQLFGHQCASDWLRFELRYGNKKRILSSDILRRPDDFFAGASDWHNSVLLEAMGDFSAEKIPCEKRLDIQTVTAECARNARWMVSTAASTLKVAIEYLDPSELWDLIGHAKLPGRLRKFSKDQISACFGGGVKAVSSFPLLSKDAGTYATYSLVPA